MNPNFANRILNADITPPNSAWDKIAAELEKLEGSGFVQKVSEASIEPPVSVWQNVSAALNASPKAKVVLFRKSWVRWAAAAAFITVVAVAAFNFWTPENASNTVSTNTNETKNEVADTSRTLNNGATSPIGSSTSLDRSIIADNSTSSPKKRINPTTVQQSQIAVRHAAIESAGIDKQNLLSSDNEPLVSSNVSSTPANIIPAPEYYVVMAPNGEKVRISSKFSDAVTSLYGGDNVDYMWKSRFDSWKSKLMTNPSFIPSAGNFLDIVELKDMLKEQ